MLHFKWLLTQTYTKYHFGVVVSHLLLSCCNIFNSWQYRPSNACLGETRRKLFALVVVASVHLPGVFLSIMLKSKPTPAVVPLYPCTPSPPQIQLS